MKYIGYVISLFIGLVLGVALIVYTTSPHPPSTVQISIENRSGMAASNITLGHEDGSASIDSLAAGASQTIPVLVFGESSYHIEATLENGAVVRGQTGYVEPGYKVIETITDVGITNNISVQ